MQTRNMTPPPLQCGTQIKEMLVEAGFPNTGPFSVPVLGSATLAGVHGAGRGAAWGALCVCGGGGLLVMVGIRRQR